MAQEDDKIKALYNGVSKDYDVGTFDEFSKKLADPTKRKAFYDGVGKEYNLGNYDEFERKLGKPSEVSTQGSKNTSGTSTEPSRISQQANPFGAPTQTSPTINVATGKTGTTKVNTWTKKPKANFVENIGDAAIAGLGQLGTIASSIPSGLIDTYGKMNPTNQGLVGGLGILGDWIKDIKTTDNDNLAIQYLGRMVNGTKELKQSVPNAVDAEQFGKITEKYTGLPEEFNPLSPNNKAVEYFAEVQKSNHDKANANYKGGIWKAIQDGEYSTAGKLATLGAVESLPLMLGLVASRGAGLSGNQALVALGVGTTEAEYQQLKEQDPNIDKNILLMNAQLTGLGEAGSELLGANLLYDQAKNLFKRGLKDEAEKIVKTGVKAFLDNMFKKSFVGASALSESSQEMTNQVWKNAIDKWSGVDPERDYTDGVIDAGIVGLVASGGFATGAKALSKIVNPKIKQEVKEQTSQISDLSTDVDNTLLPEQTRGELLKQTVKNTEKVNNKIDKELENFNQLTEPDQKKVVSINEKLDVIEEALAAEGITPTTKTTLEEQKVKLEEQLSEIKPVEEVKVTQEVKTEDIKNQPEYFDQYKTAVEGSTNVKEAFDKAVNLTENKVLSDTFKKQYNPDGTLTPEQTFERFYNSVKSIDETFENTKALTDLGTKEEYESYVENVFPESKNKTIYYHGSKSQFDEFNLENISKNSGDRGLFGEGIYLSPDKAVSENYGDKNYKVVVNVKNTFTKTAENFEKLYEKLKHLGIPKHVFDGQALAMITQRKGVSTEEVTQAIKDLGFDSAVNWTELVVFDPKNVHILGSKNDIENFKKYKSGEPVTTPEVSGIKKSLVPQEVVEKVDFEKITDKEMQGLGKGLVDSGEVKPKEIVDSITGGDRRALQPKEVVSLIYYKTQLDNQYRELLKEKNSLIEKGESTATVDKQLTDLQQDINDFEVTSVITANQQSLAFRLRKGLLDKDYNYATQVERYKATNNGVIEPDVEAKFKEYDRQLKELKEQIAQAEERAILAEEKVAVENIVVDVKRETPTKRKRAEANLKKAKDEFSQFLKKSRGQANSFADVATFVKQASKLIKAYADLGIVKVEEVIAEMRKDYGDKFVDDNLDNINEAYSTVNLDRTKPYVVEGELTVPSSYIRGVVEGGVTDINQIAKQVLTEVQKDLPEATVREVRDAITRYGKTVNQTADEITKQINQAKRLGRLYSKVEDLQNGINNSKTAKRTAELSQQERNLKKEIKDLEDALPKTEEQLEADNAKRVQVKKRYYERLIEEKQQRLRDRNFAPKQKAKPIIPDDELSRLEAKANEIRNKYDEAHFENEQANRTRNQKLKDEAIEWASGLTRALQAGLDLSAFGVQLAIYTGTSKPKQVLKTARESFRFMGSEKYQKEFFAKLQTHPLYPIMKASGLALQYPNSKLGSVDYQLSGSALNKVWNAIWYPLKFVNLNAYEIAKRVNPYRATERAFTGAIDTARMQMFLEFVDALDADGVTFENNPEQYQAAANAVNNLTFRGNLQSLEGTSKYLSLVFFAPRKVKATFELINPVFYVNTALQSPTVAKKLLWKMVTFLGVATAVTWAASWAQDDEEDISNPDLFNPYSSDFMKLRLGNTRIDMFGGLTQDLIFFARQITENYKSTSTYKTQKLGETSFVPNRLELLGKFGRNKLAPTPSILFDYMDKTKGREIDWDSRAVESVSPLWTNSIKELYKEHPTEMANFLLFMSLIGQSMNTYGTAEFLDRVADKKYIDLLSRKNGAFQNRTRASIKIVDDGTGEERGIDRVEYEVYKKEFGVYVKSELKSRYKELDEMTIPQFEKELKKIKKNAKEFAEFKIANSVGDLGTVNQSVKGKQVNYELTPEQIRMRLKYNDNYITRFGNRSMPLRTKKFMQRDKLNKEQAEKEALIEMNKAANNYSERMLFRDFRAKKIKLEVKE